MKPVSLETVRYRINLLETAQSEIGLLSLAGEFELACLRQLLAAKTQLAELAKQKPVAWCPKTQIDLLAKHRMVEADLCSEKRFDEIPLFTRPAPAAVPADDLDAKRLAFIASMQDDTAPGQYESLSKGE